VIIVFWFLPPVSQITNGHLGLLMLALIVIAIMLGFPTAFTLMGMGVIFAWLAYRSSSHETAMQQTLDLMVQRAYSVMSNDVLISIPLFVFMGYLVERSNLIEKLFRSLHLALARIPGSLAVATLVTCAVFATATGIVGAVVTLMGLLALPAMLRAGYNIKVSAGVITAGGCLGILIPPSVMLIVYGATAGVSVVKLYAGAFFPGIMLAGLYVVYVVLLAKIKPSLMPPLAESERRVTLPEFVSQIKAAATTKVLPALVAALKGRRNAGYPTKRIVREKSGRDFPDEPWEQLERAIGSVFDSWNCERAIAYRALNHIPSDWGTACNIVAMVFGNLGANSGTGVAFTRDPTTGERRFFGEYLVNAQGEDVVAGLRTPQPLETLAGLQPRAWKELCTIQRKLERHYGDMQDLEFTVEENRLYILQTRNGKRTGHAAVRIAVDMVEEKLISKKDAVKRIPADSLAHLLAPIFDRQSARSATKIGSGSRFGLLVKILGAVHVVGGVRQ